VVLRPNTIGGSGRREDHLLPARAGVSWRVDQNAHLVRNEGESGSSRDVSDETVDPLTRFCRKLEPVARA
jgi:hypothetical protein